MNSNDVREGKVIGIILTYNCEKNLEDIYNRIPKGFLDQVIVSDDASSDNTSKVAEKLGIPFFSHEHRGYGGNFKFGLRKALDLGGHYMVEIHGDGQYDPSAIPVALVKAREGYDLVMGSRFTTFWGPLKDKMSPLRFFTNIVSSFFYRLFTGIKINEFHSGFRVYAKPLLEKINFENCSEDHLFSFETILLAHYKNLSIAEVPVRCSYGGDHSSMAIWEGAIFLFDTFKVVFSYVTAKFGIKNGVFR